MVDLVLNQQIYNTMLSTLVYIAHTKCVHCMITLEKNNKAWKTFHDFLGPFCKQATNLSVVLENLF